MNATELNKRMANLGLRHIPYATSRVDAIGAVFDCDTLTARNIVDRISAKLGSIGSDPIIVLKTAEPWQICEGILEELEK